MPKLEKNFQTEFKHAFDYYLRQHDKMGLYYKIPDAGFRNPFDGFLCLEGIGSIFYELKICKTKSVINFKTLFSGREHELQYLLRADQCGVPAFVIVNHHIFPLKCAAYAFRVCPETLPMFSQQIKVDEIKLDHRIDKIKTSEGSYWDLSVILNHI